MIGIKQKYQDLFFQTEQTVNRKKSGFRAAPINESCIIRAELLFKFWYWQSAQTSGNTILFQFDGNIRSRIYRDCKPKFATDKWPFYDHFQPFLSPSTQISFTKLRFALRCWMDLNLNWFKIYDTKRKCFGFWGFVICILFFVTFFFAFLRVFSFVS
jgi:hypothetical protein